MKKLKMHTLPPAPFDEGVEIGDTFDVLRETENIIVAEINEDLQMFSKKPDEDGDSYATWFELVEE